jgi:glutamate-5-semialdehyde dehydrogenase
MQLKETFERVKRASKSLALLSDGQRNEILLAVADAIIAHKESILEANARDLAKMARENPLYDRLQLTDSRLEGIAADMRNVASLPTPLGHVTRQKTLPNGLRLHRVSVPFGVIGIIYEARPNVTFDVFSLCFKSGSACVLKGGKDADESNRVAVAIIHEVLEKAEAASHLSPLTTHHLKDVVALLPATHEATGEMLNAVGYVDLCIPRGGRKLIDFVRDTARIPVIETGAGVVNTYFDQYGDLEMGRAIITNAKTRRVSVCNALDCLIIHESRLSDLPALVEPLLTHTPPVTLYCDDPSFNALAHPQPLPEGGENSFPWGTLGEASPLLQHATAESFGTEFMDYKLAIKTVSSLDEALAHIDTYGSGHSEAIITRDEPAARQFQAHVDAACVYWNAPTSFTDGAQFGLGAEIGISTQKLGPRGPMALEEICTYKWIIEGEGQVRNS